MASIETLSPDEQDLIVTALKWVVWSIAGVTTIEISDHYREIYKSAPSEKNNSDDAVKNSTSDIEPYAKEVENIINKDPYKDPEVKDIIYHLENAGRDFFRIDRHTNFVNVDISVREWIQDSASVDSMTSGSRGFTRYRDGDGTTVFKFRLTQSFVRFGDNLSELFNERDAQMSIALNILYALNDESFQDKYMPWKTDSITSTSRSCLRYRFRSENPEESVFQKQLRYEIDHWQDHLRILQKWWTIDSIEDNWWSELLHQLSIFMRPENWYRWSMNSSGYILGYGTTSELVYRMFEDPIYFACSQGLYMIVDLLAVPSKFSTIVHAPHPRLQPLETARIECLEYLADCHPFKRRSNVYIPVYLQCSEVIGFLNLRVDPDYETDFPDKERLRTLLDQLDPLLTSAWLADWTLKNIHAAYNSDMTDRHKDILGPNFDHLDISSSEQASAISYLESHQWNRELIAAELRCLLDNHPGFYFSLTTGKLSRELPETRGGNICDRPDPRGRLPLCMAAPHPETIRHLIKHGANVNRLPLPDAWLSLEDPPIVTILLGALESQDRGAMLESAAILISEGAHLDVIASETKGTLLHLAAAARDLKFFKLLCVSGDKDWDVHARDEGLHTPLHWLYASGKAPQGTKEVKEVLEICRILIKMKRSDGEDLVNAENGTSLRPLALAAACGFPEGVKQLIELGADVHDEDDDGENCFHYLARHFGNMGGNGSKIAQILLDAKVDCASTNSKSETPLYHATGRGYLELVQLLLPRYIELGIKNPEQNPLLIQDANGQTLLHVAARHSRTEPSNYNGIFRHLIAALAQFVDIKDLIRIPELKNRETAVSQSLGCLNLDLLDYIMELDDDWGHRCLDGGNILDTICRFRKSKSQEIEHEGLVERFNKLFYRCLEAMISSPSSFSFSFLETRLFDSEPGTTDRINEVLVGLDLQKLIDLCGAPLRDCHGWSMRDVLSVGPRRSYLLDRLPKEDHSPPERFAKPSRIGLSLTNPVKISDDGLECLPLENKRQSGQYMHTILLADHPIPLIPGNFYFEMHAFSHPEGPTEMNTNAVAENPSTNRIAIGVRPMIDVFSNGWRHGTLCTSYGRIIIDGKRRPVYESGRSDLEAKVLGCGINLSDQVVFFTFDGKFETHPCYLIPERCFPTFMVLSYHTGFRVNFGAEPFVFEDANNPEWDWKIPED